MGGCTDLKATIIKLSGRQFDGLVKQGDANAELRFLYEPPIGQKENALNSKVCVVTHGTFKNAIIADMNRIIVGTYENKLLNWGSFRPAGSSFDFFGQPINENTQALNRGQVLIKKFQWNPLAADTIRTLLGTTAGHDSQQRVYFDSLTGGLSINIDMFSATIELIQALNKKSAKELPGISEQQRKYLVKTLRLEFIAKHRIDPLDPDPGPAFWSSLWGQLLIGTFSLVGVAFAFGVMVPWMTKWMGPRGGGGHGGTPLSGGSGGGSGSTGAPSANDNVSQYAISFEQGGMIYANWVTIDGEVYGLNHDNAALADREFENFDAFHQAIANSSSQVATSFDAATIDLAKSSVNRVVTSKVQRQGTFESSKSRPGLEGTGILSEPGVHAGAGSHRSAVSIESVSRGNVMVRGAVKAGVR